MGITILPAPTQISRFSVLIYILLFFAIARISQAQTVKGKVVNSEQHPIEGATVIMQTLDSLYIDASISDADGTFVLNNCPSTYRLVVQHLLYQTRKIVGNEKNMGIIQLTPHQYALDEVVVKAEHPFMKVENGRLGYNLSALPGNQTVNNVYEALMKLPGIQEKKGRLTLAGTEKLTVILNGKPTTMDAGQIETFLRNTPVDRVEKTEVMYSASPEYHVKGAVINIVMKRSNDYSFQGEISTDYKNHYFNSGGMNGSFRLSTPKMAFDVIYGAKNIKNMEYMDLYSKHTLAKQLYHIRQNEQLRSKYWDHTLRTAFEYTFNNKNYATVSYTGNYIPNQYNNSRTIGNYQTGNVDKYIDTHMHNVTLQYQSGCGLQVGGDYTYYHSTNNQHLQTDFQNGERSGFDMASGQKINRYSVYADQKHLVAKNWSLGYGFSYRLAKDRDFQFYQQVTGNIPTQNVRSNLKEQTTNFYISVGKSYREGTSFSVAATGEYYTIGCYRKWAVYPQASFTYSGSSKHLFQFSVSTDKTYPGYWSMQPFVNHLNGYTELHGTPGLKPATAYNLNGNYIFRRKYIFGIFFTHLSDYFTQTAYQSTERLALIYKNTNWNYMRLWGANVILPFKVGNWLDTRLSLTGMQMHQRCDNFFDIPFNRKKWMLEVTLDNTFKITNRLFFELKGNIQTPAIQGTFDIGALYNLTAGMKWNVAKDKISLSVRSNDIFNTAGPKLKVRFKEQYLDMNSAYYSRYFTVNVSYRFGGYKKNEIKQVDMSRFGF